MSAPLIEKNCSLCDSTAFVRPIDWTEGEQTWPTEEELNEAESRTVTVPKGWSAYQASWMPDDLEENSENDDESEEDELEEFAQIGLKPGNFISKDTIDEPVISESMDDSTTNEDHLLDLNEEEEHVEDIRFYKRSDEELQFSEEIDIDPQVSARIQLQGFRGLESLRTSPWDPKENLPKNYSRILYS
ncbi:hypothetical protein RCL1_004636 [Eukaryota sp. TZLM3-RCL]